MAQAAVPAAEARQASATAWSRPGFDGVLELRVPAVQLAFESERRRGASALLALSARARSRGDRLPASLAALAADFAADVTPLAAELAAFFACCLSISLGLGHGVALLGCVSGPCERCS